MEGKISLKVISCIGHCKVPKIRKSKQPHPTYLPLMTKPKLFPSLCKNTSMVLVMTPDGLWTTIKEKIKNYIEAENVHICKQNCVIGSCSRVWIMLCLENHFILFVINLSILLWIQKNRYIVQCPWFLKGFTWEEGIKSCQFYSVCWFEECNINNMALLWEKIIYFI